nr:hypothetical protein [Cressdnaviricota sp.]
MSNNITYVKNVYERPIIYSDFETEIWSIIIILIILLTKSIVSFFLKFLKNEDASRHVHYSNEYSTADLHIDIRRKPATNNPLRSASPPPPPRGSPASLNEARASPNTSEFDAYESFRPKIPPRDALV